MTSPIIMIWNGEQMEPHPRFSRLAEQSFTSGHAYRMVVEEERSRASHNQYFAAVHEAWMNLPERLQIGFPTETHLRKYALIEAGFCTVKRVLKGARVTIDRYAVIDTDDHGGVTVYEALSQKTRGPGAMSATDFKKSKQLVLEIVANMVGVTPEQLLKERAA
jgi:hypothetical protein